MLKISRVPARIAKTFYREVLGGVEVWRTARENSLRRLTPWSFCSSFVLSRKMSEDLGNDRETNLFWAMPLRGGAIQGDDRSFRAGRLQLLALPAAGLDHAERAGLRF